MAGVAYFGLQMAGVSPRVIHGMYTGTGVVLGLAVQNVGRNVVAPTISALQAEMQAAAAPTVEVVQSAWTTVMESATLGTEATAATAEVTVAAAEAGAAAAEVAAEVAVVTAEGTVAVSETVAAGIAGGAAGARTAEVAAVEAGVIGARLGANVGKVVGVAGGAVAVAVGGVELGFAIAALVNGPELEHKITGILEVVGAALSRSTSGTRAHCMLQGIRNRVRELQSDIVTHSRAVNGTKIGGAAAGIGAGISFILAPFTGGAALIPAIGLTATSVGVTVGTLIADAVATHKEQLQEECTRYNALQPEWATHFRLVSRWKPDTKLHIENGDIEAGRVDAGWWSAHWTILVMEPGYFHIVNGWKPDKRLHIENGSLAAGVVQPGWWSARWVAVHLGNGHFRVENKWKPDHAIHIEHGRAEAGYAPAGWLSAQWTLEFVST